MQACPAPSDPKFCFGCSKPTPNWLQRKLFPAPKIAVSHELARPPLDMDIYFYYDSNLDADYETYFHFMVMFHSSIGTALGASQKVSFVTIPASLCYPNTELSAAR